MSLALYSDQTRENKTSGNKFYLPKAWQAPYKAEHEYGALHLGHGLLLFHEVLSSTNNEVHILQKYIFIS